MAASQAAKLAVTGSVSRKRDPQRATTMTVYWPYPILPPLAIATVSTLPTSDPPATKPIKAPRLITLNRHQGVLFIGDSMMEGIAPHAISTLRKKGVISGIDLSKRSTGLTYPGIFNWPHKVREALLTHHDIGLLVVFMGPNDPWDMPSDNGGPFLRFKTPEWEARYRQRIHTILTLANHRDIPVIWIAPPTMRRNRLNQDVAWLESLYESETKQSDNVFLSANTILGYDDGIHFTTATQKMIAERIVDAITIIPASTDEGSQ